jgi:hypothetical protein
MTEMAEKYWELSWDWEVECIALGMMQTGSRHLYLR